MKYIRALLLILAVLSIYTACSEVSFKKQVDISQYSKGCNQLDDTSVACKGEETIEGGKVDILFVDDNSASMSTEQKELAARFSNFVNLLDSKSMNYRIAITTTDISSSKNPARAINQNGALQDGRLIPLGNGKKFISAKEGSASDRNLWFNNGITRQETKDCESFIKSWLAAKKSTTGAEYDAEYLKNCPSTDERGIYAAGLVIKNNPDSFLREDADLAIIFLSDEDERSGLYYYSMPGYELESQDKAATLISTLKTTYPNKSFGIHAIITTTPECKSLQDNQMAGAVSGSFGWEYKRTVDAAKAEMASRGVDSKISSKMVVGDICGGADKYTVNAKDFTGQLTDIFNHIQGQIKDSIELSCEGATNLVVTLSTSDPSIEYKIEGKVLKFNKKLPAGSNVSYQYHCPI